jgi:Domain of unknown function (DUF4192)
MALTDRPTIRVTSSEDLLALIPFLLGFHPDASLVLVVIDRGHLPTIARLPLPGPDVPDAALRETLSRLTAELTPRDGLSVALVGYGPADQVRPAVDAASGALRRAGIPVSETLRVANGRFWRLGWSPPPPQPASSWSSCWTPPAPTPPPTATTRTPSRTPRSVWRCRKAARTYLTQAQANYQAGRAVDDEPAATLTVLLDLPSLRDFAARRTSHDQWQIAMWTDLVRRAEPPFVQVQRSYWPCAPCGPATARWPTSPSTGRWTPTPTTRSRRCSPARSPPASPRTPSQPCWPTNHHRPLRAVAPPYQSCRPACRSNGKLTAARPQRRPVLDRVAVALGNEVTHPTPALAGTGPGRTSARGPVGSAGARPRHPNAGSASTDSRAHADPAARPAPPHAAARHRSRQAPAPARQSASTARTATSP